MVKIRNSILVVQAEMKTEKSVEDSEINANGQENSCKSKINSDLQQEYTLYKIIFRNV